MTFEKFEEIIRTKYPEAKVGAHGKATKGDKVLVFFAPNTKGYEYSGAYDHILCNMGINVVSKMHYEETKRALETAVERNGKKSFFGGVMDTTKEIEKYQAMLADFESNYIIA